jgi:hypothetical protein
MYQDLRLKDAGKIYVRNVGTNLPNHIARGHRKPQTWCSPAWEITGKLKVYFKKEAVQPYSNRTQFDWSCDITGWWMHYTCSVPYKVTRKLDADEVCIYKSPALNWLEKCEVVPVQAMEA